MRGLLRLSSLLPISSLIGQYNTHIWSIAEYSDQAITLAWRIVKMQIDFLHKLAITDTQAFVDFNFAAPAMRRVLGLLPLVHKRILQICRPEIC